MSNVGLYAYMDGIAQSIENAMQIYQQSKALDMEKEKMFWDYSLNKTRLNIEKKRVAEEEYRADERLTMAKEKAANDKQMFEISLEQAGYSRDAMKKELDVWEEKYNLNKKITNADLSGKLLRNEMATMDIDVRKEAKRLNEIRAEINDKVGRLMEDARKEYNGLVETQKRIDIRSDPELVGAASKTLVGELGEKLSTFSQKKYFPSYLQIGGKLIGELISGGDQDATDRFQNAIKAKQRKKAKRKHPDLINYRKLETRYRDIQNLIMKRTQELDGVSGLSLLQEFQSAYPGFFERPVLNNDNVPIKEDPAEQNLWDYLGLQDSTN